MAFFRGLALLMNRGHSHQVLTWRNLTSKQLVYTEFGDPLQVVKFRESQVPPLRSTEVLVRMLAAPVNPADLNTIQGRHFCKPYLPWIPGDEGVGEVVEVGKSVSVKRGSRVIITKKQLGTWRCYGVYNESHIRTVPTVLPLAEAAMLAVAPCIAYRLLKDFQALRPGVTVMQNGANSAVGQSVIQLCKAWDIKTLNIVSNDNDIDRVKNYLIDLGADAVYTPEEAERITRFDTSMARPILALNCEGGRNENLLLKLLEYNGVIVYHGNVYNSALDKKYLRCDVMFCRFDIMDWELRAPLKDRTRMIMQIIELMVSCKFHAPRYIPIDLRHYVYALQNTPASDAKNVSNFIFDFTLP